MSGLPPKADIRQRIEHVCFGATSRHANANSILLEHLIERPPEPASQPDDAKSIPWRCVARSFAMPEHRNWVILGTPKGAAGHCPTFVCR